MPVNATSLLHLPMDCAEQTMFSFAANLYTTMYMRYVNQRNRTQERGSFFHMNVGYQRQLSFMNPDGSFSSFRTDWYVHIITNQPNLWSMHSVTLFFLNTLKNLKLFRDYQT